MYANRAAESTVSGIIGACCHTIEEMSEGRATPSQVELVSSRENNALIQAHASALTH